MAKTGIDVLMELVEQVKLLNKKVDVLDQNIKVLMNANRTPTPKAAPKPAPSAQAVEPPVKSTNKPDDPARFAIIKTKGTGGIMVNGSVSLLISGKDTPVSEGIITIYDETNQVVRQTKTNRGGKWVCLLKPGKYAAEIKGEYKGKPIVTQNKIFELQEGMKQFEVI